jgi:hypothetical protein
VNDDSAAICVENRREPIRERERFSSRLERSVARRIDDDVRQIACVMTGGVQAAVLLARRIEVAAGRRERDRRRGIACSNSVDVDAMRPGRKTGDSDLDGEAFVRWSKFRGAHVSAARILERGDCGGWSGGRGV